MKKLNIFLIAFVVATLSSCQIITGAFKAGVAVTIIGILIVVFLIVWLISAFRGRN
jgi:hypothetical protein